MMRGSREEDARRHHKGSSVLFFLFPFTIFSFLREVPEIGGVGREGGVRYVAFLSGLGVGGGEEEIIGQQGGVFFSIFFRRVF